MKIHKKLSLLTVLLTALIVPACASVPGEGSLREDRNIITAEEMASIEVATLFEVVQRLRPQWLQVRGGRSFGSLSTDIVVFQNNTMLGGIDALRRLGDDAAFWLEYMPGSEASNRLSGLGSRHVEGAIIIHTTPREEGN